MSSLNDRPDERLMPSMHTIKCADGQDRFLPKIGPGQIIYYVHIATVLSVLTVRMPCQDAKTFLGRHCPEEAW